MNPLIKEKFTPEGQENDANPKSYVIKALSSIQLTEVMMEGFENKDGVMKMKFPGVKLLLKYGLEDPSLINSMPSHHHVKVAHAIYNKAALSEIERKNS